MSATIHAVDYYYTTVRDRPGEAYKLLTQLASQGVHLLAFSAVPVGPEYTQLQLFPESPERLTRLAGRTGFALTGPQRAFLIQGDDQLEAIADIHAKLFDAQINVYASNGVTDGRGGYGYILYVRPEHFDAAARVLRL